MRAARLALAVAAGAVTTCAAAVPIPPQKINPDSGSDELAVLPLEQLLELQVVTSPSRFAQAIADAPSAVVVLTAQDIRDHGWRTLGDALASLPGLYVTNDRNYSYLGARGFLRPGDYDSRFLLLIDGMRTNDAVYDQAMVGTDGLLDMDLVQRIEYVPGPGSAVYGANALFGVINVITRTGSSKTGTQVAVAGAGFGEKRVRVTHGWHGQNGADAVLSASAYTRRGQDLYFPEYDTPDQNHGVARGLDYDRSHSLYAKGTYGGWTVSAAYVARTKGIPTGSFGAVFDTPNYTRDTQSFVRAGYAGELAPDLGAMVHAFWGRADYFGIGSYPDDAGLPRASGDGDHAAWYGAGAQLTWSGLPSQKIVAGLDVQRNRRRDQFNYDFPYSVQLDDHRADARAGLFIEDEVQLAPGWILNAGLRYDWDDTTGANTNPRVALIWHANASDTAKLIYGTAYRAPNAYELYYAFPGEGGQLANPALHAEHISTRELILEHRYGDPGFARLALFRYSTRDLIAQQTLDDGMLQFLNTDHATANGAELSIERQVGNGLRLRASHSWQRVRDSGGAALVNSPQRLFKLNAAMPLLGYRARLAGEIQCMSARRTENAMTGGYCVTNATLGSIRLAQHTDLSFSVYNLFDARYADPAGPAFRQEALMRQSRTLALKLVGGF
ncbi:TonB-dependent receptor plug domain-containing protein [Pseudoduganella rivuli]|uniref:TonB-dependent receptor plug domain-containing protein n=1 Tax=Pseudoduganella rivuli TaxID=2666085 RepID=UPI001E4390F1|nr:TonB-dependent receptor [Pseudoduganella rivuli]